MKKSIIPEDSLLKVLQDTVTRLQENPNDEYCRDQWVFERAFFEKATGKKAVIVKSKDGIEYQPWKVVILTEGEG